MLKRDLYFKALSEDAHLRKVWVISGFSVVRPNEDNAPQPWDIRYGPKLTEVYARQEDGTFTWEPVEDVQPYIPVFKAGEPLSVKAGEVPNLREDVESTYGDVLFNYRVLVYAFGNMLPYQVGPVQIRKLERIIAARMTDNVTLEDEVPGVIYVRHYLRFGQAMSDLAGFTQLFVPAASAKSEQTHPDARKRREELLAENKDRLHDPAVVAKIQNELVKMDREWIKGDTSEGFFSNPKQFNTSRKRQFLIHGPEAGFSEGGNAELVINSLEEGWDMSKLPAMVNSLRAGSYYRGALTALGGESVKFFLRVFQNTYISEQDCGTKVGFKKLIDGDLNTFEGLFQITPNGVRELTLEILEGLKGQTIVMRTPLACRTAHTDYCATCMGRRNAENPLGLGAMAAEVGSTFMSIMLASAHAKELKTARLRVNSFLT